MNDPTVCGHFHKFLRRSLFLHTVTKVYLFDHYSSLSNKRDDHGTFTSPKVTLITLLLASITHTRGTRRAQKFSKIKDQNSKLALK